ncbi:hypothetical protein V6N11_060523 [Hibiscus sabdariffa]|uniref:Uncharacterized protein n=1 Tax=Hibiscus sabdariffa TaxID=183260 RepID=A0ABR2QQT7_9ROSI
MVAGKLIEIISSQSRRELWIIVFWDCPRNELQGPVAQKLGRPLRKGSEIQKRDDVKWVPKKKSDSVETIVESPIETTVGNVGVSSIAVKGKTVIAGSANHFEILNVVAQQEGGDISVAQQEGACASGQGGNIVGDNYVAQGVAVVEEHAPINQIRESAKAVAQLVKELNTKKNAQKNNGGKKKNVGKKKNDDVAFGGGGMTSSSPS